MIKNEEWDYAPIKDRALAASACLTSMAGYGLALSQLFNPVALGVAAGYAVLKTGYDYYSDSKETPSGQKKAVQGYIKAGLFEPVEKDHPFQKTVDEMAEACGTKPLTAYYATDKEVRATFPWFMRSLVSEREVERVAQRYAATISSMNVVFTTKQFLEEHSADSIRFVLAHEVSHCKTKDAYDSFRISDTFKSNMTSALAAGLIATTGLLISGTATIPAFTIATTSIASLISSAYFLMLTNAASTLGLNFASRITERRADRNALYLTRDLDGAINSFDGGHKVRLPAFMELSTHPTYHPRVANLKKAFAEAAQYPPPPTAKKPEQTTAPKFY